MRPSKQPRITSRSTGIFSPKNWLEEGDGLFETSQLNRKIWREHEVVMQQYIAENGTLQFPGSAKDIALLTGLPRASMLLLGYATAMYLKAGIAKAYWGCAESMFSEKVKKYFGHHLLKMADELCFPFRETDKDDVETLRRLILVDARYPLEVNDAQKYVFETNTRNNRIWSDEIFNRLSNLSQRVRSHSAQIDADETNPSFKANFKIDDDGYLVFRTGGHLPPRITYKISSHMNKLGQTDLEDIRALLTPEQNYLRILSNWEKAKKFEDSDQNRK